MPVLAAPGAPKGGSARLSSTGGSSAPASGVGVPTTSKSPYVTLQPPSPSGGIPGDATDPMDFFGILIAIAVVLVVVFAVRLAFRGRGRVHEDRREPGPPPGGP